MQEYPNSKFNMLRLTESIPDDEYSSRIPTTEWVKRTIENHTGNTNPYTLPIASTVRLGGIKVGDGLSIDQFGVLSTVSINNITKNTPTIIQSISISSVGDGSSISWTSNPTPGNILIMIGTAKNETIDLSNEWNIIKQYTYDNSDRVAFIAYTTVYNQSSSYNPFLKNINGGVTIFELSNCSLSNILDYTFSSGSNTVSINNSFGIPFNSGLIIGNVNLLSNNTLTTISIPNSYNNSYAYSSDMTRTSSGFSFNPSNNSQSINCNFSNLTSECDCITLCLGYTISISS